MSGYGYGYTVSGEDHGRISRRMMHAIGVDLPQIEEEELQDYISRHEGTLATVEQLHVFWYIGLEEFHHREAAKATKLMVHHQNAQKATLGEVFSFLKEE